jgi:hypothetical protein
MNNNSDRFIHFLSRVAGGRQSHFVSPAEPGEIPYGGGFAAPTMEDGRFFNWYHFHYSYYLGKGEFLEKGGRKRIFFGSATKTTDPRYNRETLVFSFEPTPPELFIQLGPSQALLRSVRGTRNCPEVPFRRVPRRREWPYVGRLQHPDFACPFVGIEPRVPGILDEIFDKYRISIIGCDPSTEYKG